MGGYGGDTAVNVKDKRHNENESYKGGVVERQQEKLKLQKNIKNSTYKRIKTNRNWTLRMQK